MALVCPLVLPKSNMNSLIPGTWKYAGNISKFGTKFGNFFAQPAPSVAKLINAPEHNIP